MTSSKTLRTHLPGISIIFSGLLLCASICMAKPALLRSDFAMGAPSAAALVAERAISAAVATPITEMLEGPGLPVPPPREKRPVGDPLPEHWNMIPTYQDVPEYRWWYGCSPTAAGMLFGWWDAQPGTKNLFDGDASAFWGDAGESADGGTRAMVASMSHIVAGQENGFNYGDWHNSPSYPQHEENPMSLADFMKTVDGSTGRSKMAEGLEAFARWDAPWTMISESYSAVATTYYKSLGWTFADFQAEIDAGYPIHLGITMHSVLAFGWYDLSTAAQPDDYGYIAYNTWGWGLTEWRWDGANVPSQRSVYAATYLRVIPEPVVGAPLIIAAAGFVAVVGRPFQAVVIQKG